MKTPLEAFKHEARLQQFAQELSTRTYAQRYETLYFIAIFCAFTAQALSLWSSYEAVLKLVKIKIQHPEISKNITIFLLIVIEMLKYNLMHTALKDIFNIQPTYPYIIILLACSISVASIYLSISGSTEIAKDTKQETQISTEQTTKERELKAEIASIQNTDTYKKIV